MTVKSPASTSAIYDIFETSSTPLHTQVVPDDTDLLLELGVVVPPSYREWIKRFGHGETCHIFLFYVPLPDNHPDDLSRFSREMKRFFEEGIVEDYFEYEPDGSEEVVRRLVPFGRSIDGHYFAWDSASTAGSEPAVYAIGPKMLAVTRAGRDFPEFLASCFDERVARVLGPSYEPLPRTFKPTELQW